MRNNPWSAKRYYDEAQKLEDAAEDEAANEGEEGGMKVNDKTDAVAVITTSGTIRVVNRCLVKMFGYRRQEDLIGKNVRHSGHAPTLAISAGLARTEHCEGKE